MERYGNQPFRPFGGGGFAEHVGRHGGGPHDLLWVIFGIVLAILLVAIVSLALDAYYRSQGQRPFMKWLPAGGPPGMFRGGRALAILDARYARGEISRKEYLQAREDMRGVPDEDDDAPTEEKPPPRRRRRQST